MKKTHTECDYEEMTHEVGGQSQPEDYWEEPMQNDYEINHKKFYGDNGVDWSGMKGE